MTVVVAGKFDNQVPARKSAGETDGTHGGFGARIDETDFVDAGNGFDDSFRQLILRRCGCSEAGSPLQAFFDSRFHRGMGMAEDHRSPRSDVIDVAVAVHIPETRSPRALDEGRFPSHGAERSGGAIDATGHQGSGFLKKCLTLGACHRGWHLAGPPGYGSFSSCARASSTTSRAQSAR